MGGAKSQSLARHPAGLLILSLPSARDEVDDDCTLSFLTASELSVPGKNWTSHRQLLKHTVVPMSGKRSWLN